MELTKAIPPAAAVPTRIAVGKLQKMDKEAMIPTIPAVAAAQLRIWWANLNQLAGCHHRRGRRTQEGCAIGRSGFRAPAGHRLFIPMVPA
jgi:hypothetical protein